MMYYLFDFHLDVDSTLPVVFAIVFVSLNTIHFHAVITLMKHKVEYTYRNGSFFHSAVVELDQYDDGMFSTVHDWFRYNL